MFSKRNNMCQKLIILQAKNLLSIKNKKIKDMISVKFQNISKITRGITKLILMEEYSTYLHFQKIDIY